MSTKALHEALDYLENNPTADEAQDARRRARTELEAIERALAVGHRIVSGDLHVISRGRLNEAVGLMQTAHEAEISAAGDES